MKPQSTKSRKHGHVFIAMPTLDIMISSCNNCKEQADIANMEYSNFMKHCKMRTDIRLNTYARCASAFDMDVMLIHLPKGLIDSLVKPSLHDTGRFSSIDKDDLNFIMNKISNANPKLISNHFIKKLYQVEERLNTDDNNSTSQLLKDFLKQLISIYERQ